MKLTITGYSTALYSTWFLVEELNLLLDAGDGVSAGLLGKTGKIKQVLISHADRDHLTGLLQLNQLNARPGFPVISYPKDCGSFSALAQFSAQFDPHVSNAVWNPIEDGTVIQINKEIIAHAVRNEHVQVPPGRHKSLSYKIIRQKKKLKAALVGKSGEEIRQLSMEKGEDAITDRVEEAVLAYSGDTPVDDYARWDNSAVLIHEATFLGNEVDSGLKVHGNRHSTLAEVMEMVANIKVEKLILSHFSPRYKSWQIDEAIRKQCDKFGIKIPVYRLLPGQIHRDILSQNPVNA